MSSLVPLANRFYVRVALETSVAMTEAYSRLRWATMIYLVSPARVSFVESISHSQTATVPASSAEGAGTVMVRSSDNDAYAKIQAFAAKGEIIGVFVELARAFCTSPNEAENS